MSQTANNIDLPSGLRSSLVHALHSDDPQALLQHLESSIHLERSILRSAQGGQVPSNKKRKPWSWFQANTSLIRSIDNELYCRLDSDFGHGQANLHTLAFALAAYCGSLNVVKLFLSDKYRDNVDPTYDENYAMRLASANGHVEIITLLLSDARVDPTTRNNQAIRDASGNGHVAVVRQLLDAPRVDPTTRSNESFRNACKQGHLQVVTLLLTDPRIDPSANRNESILEAIEIGHVEVVKLLLSDSRVDPSAYSDQAIRDASKQSNVEIVDLLLNDTRVDPTAHSNESIRNASAHGQVEVIHLLLSDVRVDPSSWSNISIRLASQKGHVEAVKLLLNDSRVDPSDHMNEAMYSACINGHFEVVKLLLSDKRVDPSDDKNTAIRDASENGHREVVKLLLRDVRVDPSIDKVVIEKALEWANVGILRLLLALNRIVITNELLGIVDLYSSSDHIDALFEAAHPRIWPRVIGNDLACAERKRGHLRKRLDVFEVKSSWMLLLCVKNICTPRVAARVGDVLREVCAEWTLYQSQEVEPLFDW